MNSLLIETKNYYTYSGQLFLKIGDSIYQVAEDLILPFPSGNSTYRFLHQRFEKVQKPIPYSQGEEIMGQLKSFINSL